jgi:hypothetical protein
MPGALTDPEDNTAKMVAFGSRHGLGTKYARPVVLGRDAVRELHEAIVALVESRAEVMCAECLAIAVGRSASAVVMAMRGLVGRVTSLHGVCSGCHRRAMVAERVARHVVASSPTVSRPSAKDTPPG